METFKVFSYDSLPSTNDKAKEILNELNGERSTIQSEENNGFVVIAKSQTRGKGRFDRKWVSERGGIYQSIAIRKITEKPQLLSLCASLAVHTTLENIGVKIPSRGVFNLSHEKKMTGDMGYLYPKF